MAVLYEVLWRVLCALIGCFRVHVWRWKRAAAGLLLPLAVGFHSHRTAGPAGKPTGRALQKVPLHVGLIITEDEIQYTAVASLVLWCMTAGVSYVSLYDHRGVFRRNNSRLMLEIMRQQKDLLGTDSSRYSVEFLKNTTDHPQHEVLCCQSVVRVLSADDGHLRLVQAAQQLCKTVEKKEKTSRDIDVAMIDSLLRESQNRPDPELVLMFGAVESTLGFLPWHIRLAEIISLPSHMHVSCDDLIGAVRRYAACEQRLGK